MGLINGIVPQIDDKTGLYCRDKTGTLKADVSSIPDIIKAQDDNGKVIYSSDKLDDPQRHAFIDVGKAQALTFGGIKKLYQLTKESIFNIEEALIDTNLEIQTLKGVGYRLVKV